MSDRDRVDKAKVSIKRKAETITPSSLPLKRGPGRPRKDRTQDLYLTPSSIMPSSMPQVCLLLLGHIHNFLIFYLNQTGN